MKYIFLSVLLFFGYRLFVEKPKIETRNEEQDKVIQEQEDKFTDYEELD